jgi:phosphotransferase system HPr (HPr) family protein
MEKIEQDITVSNPHGLHVRSAGLFVQIANKYDSSVRMGRAGEEVEGKSIMELLTLGVNKGATVHLIVEGVDAEEAFRELKEYLEKGND